MPLISFEVRGQWPLQNLPAPPEPWMVPGRTYVLVLRRRSPQDLPEAEVRDAHTDAVLATYSWHVARAMFAFDAHDDLSAR